MQIGATQQQPVHTRFKEEEMRAGFYTAQGVWVDLRPSAPEAKYRAKLARQKSRLNVKQDRARAKAGRPLLAARTARDAGELLDKVWAAGSVPQERFASWYKVWL